MISILVADDHGIVREGLRRLLEAEPDLKVVAEAEDGREVLIEVERHRPDIVVLDITMPRMGGLETLERLRTAHQGTKVILQKFKEQPFDVRRDKTWYVEYKPM